MTLIQILESREGALDVHQVAELLKVSERHIYELAAGGSLPSFRVGKVIRFDPQDVADWLRRKKPVGTQESPHQAETHINVNRNRTSRQSTSPNHILRRQITSIEAAFALDSSSDDTSVNKH